MFIIYPNSVVTITYSAGVCVTVKPYNAMNMYAHYTALSIMSKESMCRVQYQIEHIVLLYNNMIALLNIHVSL